MPCYALSSDEKPCKKAKRLHKKALRLEERKRYYRSAKYYDESLELCYSEAVYKDYMRVVSTIGPM